MRMEEEKERGKGRKKGKAENSTERSIVLFWERKREREERDSVDEESMGGNMNILA